MGKCDVNYSLAGRDQRKFVKDSKFSPSENWKRKVVLEKKIWKLHDNGIRSDFSYYIKEFNDSREANVSTEIYKKIFKWALLEATDRTWG